MEVYYDGNCGMCQSFVKWLGGQKHEIELVLLPFAGEEAKDRFPEIMGHEPDKLMVTRTDNGEVFRGAESWVLCLWAIKKYRWLAKRMASPAMLPMAQKVCVLVAANRFKISKLLFGGNDKALVEEIEKLDTKGCDTGSCRIDENKE